MRWLRTINKLPTKTVVRSKMFVFDEAFVAEDLFSEFLTDISMDPNKKIVYDVQNWDQAGILTRIIAYEEKIYE